MQEHDYLIEAPKRKRRKIHNQWASLRINHCQWHPDDDYLLINSVLHLMNISYVFYGVKFSKPYQEKEIEKRWKELLFNESRSSLALEAIRNISVFDKDILDKQIPFNEAENQKLNKITYNEVYADPKNPLVPSIEPFKQLLQEDKSNIFYKNRTGEQLFKAWTILRKHINESVKLGGDPHKFEDVDMLIRRIHDNPIIGAHNSTSSHFITDINSDYKSFQRLFAMKQQKILLPDNNIITESILGSSFPGNVHGNINNINTTSSGTSTKSNIPSRPLSTRSSSIEDQNLINELLESDKDNRRRLYGKLRKIGEEARRWTTLVEAVTGKPISDRQANTSLATLTGLNSRFLIKEKEVTFGRKTCTVKPDMDLSSEGPANRISRLQGCIKLLESPSTQFALVNWDKQPIFVDGAVVLSGEELALSNNSMITIGGLNFRFNVNEQLLQNYTEFESDDVDDDDDPTTTVGAINQCSSLITSGGMGGAGAGGSAGGANIDPESNNSASMTVGSINSGSILHHQQLNLMDSEGTHDIDYLTDRYQLFSGSTCGSLDNQLIINEEDLYIKPMKHELAIHRNDIFPVTINNSNRPDDNLIDPMNTQTSRIYTINSANMLPSCLANNNSNSINVGVVAGTSNNKNNNNQLIDLNDSTTRVQIDQTRRKQILK